MIVALAGLPGTGKTTLALGLRDAIGAVVISKDAIRRAAFGPSAVDYSAEQDDVCMEMAYMAARYVLGRDPDATVVLDGRTYTQRRHVVRLLEAAGDVGAGVRVIRCVCSADEARRRLDSDARHRAHPAANRDGPLHDRVAAAADPLVVPHLVVDTGELSPEDALARAMDYLFDASGP